MARSRSAVLLLLLLSTAALFAQPTPQTITPNSGPAAGGQEVLIKGDFGFWPYGVIFGSSAVSAVRVDEHTLRVTTPPHPAGTVPVTIFEYDMGISTDLTYTFTGEPTGALERVLLPIFVPPVSGANGSLFRTDFRALNRKPASYILTYGLLADCPIAPNCTYPTDLGFVFGNGQEVKPGDVVPSGRPGAFIYVPTEEAQNLVLQLRVYDVSRDATNFGTEIPVVREYEMTIAPVTLLGVPTDARFRSTLRIYAEEERAFVIRAEGANGVVMEEYVYAEPGENIFDPAYAMFTDFPTGVGPLRVTITALEPIVTPPALPVRFWAFISVTNNDTQHITVISPQR